MAHNFNIGDGASYNVGSDRHPVTVIAISKSGKTITVQAADWEVVSGSEYDGSAKYTYNANPNGATYKFRLNSKGYWKMLGTSSILSPGYVRYYDPHF